MKTIKATNQMLYQILTSTTPGVPAGKVHVRTVQYRTFEMDLADFDETTFQIHDAACVEASVIASLVRDV